jgi:hypothetical protein
MKILKESKNKLIVFLMSLFFVNFCFTGDYVSFIKTKIVHKEKKQIGVKSC